MDRFELMGWKALAPGLVWMAAALAVMWALSGLQDNPYTAGLFGTLRWGPVAMLGWGALLTAHAFYRMWRCEHGEGLLCGCGGMLGQERNGRWGVYRKCMACARKVNRRDYE